MRSFPALLLLSVGVLFGCAGLAGEDTAENEPADTGTDNEVPDWQQTSSCEDYLACLEAVSPAEAAEAEDTYGEDGSCWGEDDAAASACDQACEDLYGALAEDHTDEPACGGEATDTGTDTGKDTGTDTGSDTGTDTGGDTGSSGPCPMDSGTWSFTQNFTSDGCGVGSGFPTEVSVDCDAGEMSLTVLLTESMPMTLACDTNGRDFDCIGTDTSLGVPLTFEYAGSANGSGTTASGTVAIALDTVCTSSGTFSASL